MVRCLTALLLLLLFFFFYRGHPRFWNFYSTIPVDVVRVKSYMNCLFDPTCVLMRVTIKKKLTSFQSGLFPVLWACSETADVSVRANRMSWSCSLILPCIGLPVSPMSTLPHSQGILWTTPSCLARSTASFAIVKCLYERAKRLVTKPSVISEEKKTPVICSGF